MGVRGVGGNQVQQAGSRDAPEVNTKKPEKTLLRSNIQDFVQEVPFGACRGPPPRKS